MNWEAIGAVGEVGGAIAVVATLGYLGVQIRQNTRTLRTTVHDTQTAGHSEYLIEVAGDPILAPIVRKAFASEPFETDGESFRFRLLVAGIFIRFQNSYYADRSGSLEPELWDHWSRALDAYDLTRSNRLVGDRDHISGCLFTVSGALTFKSPR